MTTPEAYATIQNKILSIEDTELNTYRLNVLKREYSVKDSPQKDKDTAKRKGQFKNERLIYVHYIYVLLLFLYFLVLLGGCYILFNADRLEITKKIVILGCLLIIPIISTKVLYFILYMITSFYETLPKNVNLELQNKKL